MKEPSGLLAHPTVRSRITPEQRAGLFSSIRQDWATPWRLLETLNNEFHFQLDACATAETACCKYFYTEGALAKAWADPTWCNPPYGRAIGRWVEKGFREAREHGNTVVMLLPSRTDTQWWHDYCLKASEIRFLRWRLCFDDSQRKRAPFPSAVVVFRGSARKENVA